MIIMLESKKFMLRIKSESLYRSLEKFFAPESETIRELLFSGMFDKSEINIIQAECAGVFCLDFFLCLNECRKLQRKYQMQHLKTLFKELKQIFNPHECKVFTANEPTEKQKQEIEEQAKRLGGDNLNFYYYINRSIIAGTVLAINGRYYDASMKYILQCLRTRLIKDMRERIR